MFFHELDEGLWFYLRDRILAPVPGSQPRYNEGVDLDEDLRDNRLVVDPDKRLEIEKRDPPRLARPRPDRGSPYVLIRTGLRPVRRDLAGLATPVYRERGLKRNELVLLRVDPAPRATAGRPATTLR